MSQRAPSRTRVSRSPSKSRSRSSEKILDGSTDKLAIPPFRLVTKSPSPCSRRRASAVHFTQSSPAGATKTSHTRSRSLRAKRHSAVLPHSSSGTQLAQHSLSVPTGDLGDFHLVRNFSVTSKGVVNRGDSFRCKSRSASLCSTPTTPTRGSDSASAFPEFESTASTSSSPVPTAASEVAKDVPKYTVWLMGSNGVGKSAIRNQFMTSEYICQYDTWKDETQTKSVMVSLDGEEAELDIVEYATIDDKSRPKDPLPDAFLVVYSVTNRRSYLQARQILSKLETSFGTRAAILVGNKTDLARLRTVPTVEGRSLAKERGCKFVETSVAINHQLDELLVGVITQIRIKARIAEKRTKKSGNQQRNCKATCIIKRLWRRTCMASKSCDNLHAL
ncbi:hypothetical protein JTE90_015410 [Oedothorax gibbosus]|uniref:GTP-binding protein GEM n=1 Tax=Oedothorax gibbosus TaxID=931172 RepID=A0AAV6U7N8_9ARAC|nr:hypothetical protein JTE90_015410 [Oedothorax gibbosus]